MKRGFCGYEFRGASGVQQLSDDWPAISSNALAAIMKTLRSLHWCGKSEKCSTSRRADMKLSEKAEEILEELWIKVEEEGNVFTDMEKIQLLPEDPVFQELTDLALIEVKEGRVYLRPEGKEEGRKIVRRFRLAERLMMDVFNIRGDAAREKACQFEHLLNEGVDTKLHPAQSSFHQPARQDDSSR
jgi:Mn-dependent DtxR family transcriptional regulator